VTTLLSASIDLVCDKVIEEFIKSKINNGKYFIVKN